MDLRIALNLKIGQTPVIIIAGVLSVPFPADVIATLGPGSGWARFQVESKNSALLGRGVKDIGALDKPEQLQLPDDVVALALFKPGGLRQFGHRSKTFGLPNFVRQL